MTHTHDHEHDHNHEPDYITLVDENGNESLFQILITIDGQEEFGKNYVVYNLLSLKKMNKVLSMFWLTHLLRMLTVLRVICNQSLKMLKMNGI